MEKGLEYTRKEHSLIPQLVSGSDTVIDDNLLSEPAVPYAVTPTNDSSYLKLVHVSREGLSYKKFVIAEKAFALSKQELSTILHISDRTLDRIHKDKKRLSTPQTERVLELSMLYDHGWSCFGSKENFRAWMDNAYIPYGGVTPLSLLDTTHGIEMIHTALGRIEHGIPA